MSFHILKVPLQNCNNDFTFVVNNEEFKTSRIISDLLSSKISRIHLIDPTFNKLYINTQERGHFSTFLQLVNFDEINLSDDEISFICEVIEILETDSIDFFGQICEEINENNVFTLIHQHEKYPKIFSNLLQSEIEFISSHFYELCENHKNDLESLQIDTLNQIVNDEKLKLNDEDQLLKFINSIYSKETADANSSSILYESVQFVNVTTNLICEFIEMFDLNDITNSIWKLICQRLKQSIEMKDETENRYNYRIFTFSEEKVFNGIIKYLNTKSLGHIEDEINVTSSPYAGSHDPINVIKYENQEFFHSQNIANSWICFDFKEHKVIPTSYTIKSVYYWHPSNYSPINWVIEGSNDKNEWIKLDEENVCYFREEKSIHHTFDIKYNNSNQFKYIRIKQTGKNWHNDDYFIFGSFEIYGKYI